MGYLELSNYLSINKKINKNISNQHYLFDFYLEYVYKCIFDLYVKIFDVQLIEEKNARLDQDSFRLQIIERDVECIVSQACDEECEACHIIPLEHNKNNFDVNNGILLSAQLPITFDKYYWTIDHETNSVSVKDEILNGKFQK